MSESTDRSGMKLSAPEAFAAIALIAVAADGYITGSESQAVTATLSRMQLFGEYSGEQKRELLDRLLTEIKTKGYEDLLKAAIQSIPKELRETAFAIATDITLADGEIAEEEENLLNDLYSSLEISEDIATQIIDVMLIKNRG
ncbi:tellurite resistance TerB family protein [Lyngbya sp. CCY1209]|jgi:tellurite resistance protein|uniref:tellurite resistance TerB family protein n=1 Tax=Lyngbya sp. CCY1209 TaxID=2886103 RepID=UPI002D2129C9|nr:tellurite resistance TerB family protein [Lyngbya sp. CCY1209]MEB3887213.1 tellurite resistance TerB family protein [Lyngbya sp. CCY1209]